MNHVLIVDGYAPVLRVLRLGLEDAGYGVGTATSGSECLVRLCKGLPDFLITDFDTPRMNGKDLCLAIGKQFPNRTFPIVVLTSRADVNKHDWADDIDNLSFMEKPVSIRRLVAFIGRSFAGEACETGT